MSKCEGGAVTFNICLFHTPLEYVALSSCPLSFLGFLQRMSIAGGSRVCCWPVDTFLIKPHKDLLGQSSSWLREVGILLLHGEQCNIRKCSFFLFISCKANILYSGKQWYPNLTDNSLQTYKKQKSEHFAS